MFQLSDSLLCSLRRVQQAIKAVSKTETERKLGEALSKENWGASSTMLREIAGLTYDWQHVTARRRPLPPPPPPGTPPRC